MHTAQFVTPVSSSKMFAGWFRLSNGMSTALAVLLCAALGGCQATVQTEPADLVLTGGRVVAVDAAGTEAEALAVRGSTIVALGSAAEIEHYIGDQTEVIDLAGRLAIPGFIEGHGHFLSLGNALSILDLTSASSWQDIVDQVAEAVAGAEPGVWIYGRGWHQEKWSAPPAQSVEGNPVHDALSAVSPENPVLLGHASGHAAFANAKAMELSGINGSTPNPFGGEIVRKQNGKPTGLLRETAQRLVRNPDADADDSADARRKLVELAGTEALRNGVTSFHDAGVSFDDVAFFESLEAERALPIRLYVMVRASNDELSEGLGAVRSESEGDDYLVVRSIKKQIDGALGAHGAWLLEPYEDMASSTGLTLESPEEIRRTAQLALEHGFQLNTHAIGDRANREVLDIYAAEFAAADAADHRWRVEHAQHLHPDDVGRFAELGVVASMQGVHCTSDAPWVFKRLGAERAENGAYLWRSLMDAGVVINNGTDVPVENIDPIQSYYASVGRVTKDGSVFFGDQVMSRMEALSSYTINNAYAAFEEDSKGSLEVGKLADIAVLSGDLLEVPLEQIPEIVVDLTLLGGEVVYRR